VTLDIEREDFTDPADRRVSQLIGQSAWMMGIEAIRYPSSPSPEQANLVVFVDQLGSESRVIKRYVQLFRP
jgi:hypothetical protein